MLGETEVLCFETVTKTVKYEENMYILSKSKNTCTQYEYHAQITQLRGIKLTQ